MPVRSTTNKGEQVNKGDALLLILAVAAMLILLAMLLDKFIQDRMILAPADPIEVSG